MRLTLYLPLLLLCALSIAACTSAEEARELEDREREFSLGGEIADYIDQGFVQVQCPDDIDADEGRHFRCVVKAADGMSVAVDVVAGVESDLRVLTKLLETRKVEARLRHDLNVGRPRAALVWLLDCQDLVEVEKGGRFTCEGIAVPNSSFTVRAVFTNDLGMLRYTVRPSRVGARPEHPVDLRDQAQRPRNSLSSIALVVALPAGVGVRESE